MKVYGIYRNEDWLGCYLQRPLYSSFETAKEAIKGIVEEAQLDIDEANEYVKEFGGRTYNHFRLVENNNESNLVTYKGDADDSVSFTINEIEVV